MKKEWPDLQYDKLKDTIATVQLWTQIVGKIKLIKMPWLNHSWHVTFTVSPHGLTTGGINYNKGIFELSFDFIDHQLLIITSEGDNERVSLYPRTVASFYNELFEKLKALDIDVKIYAKPNEINPAIPFEKDEVHQSYDKEQINLFWKALVKIEPVLNKFRAGFSGKCSPVHFFWGSFDLAVTRFSGRVAPKYSGVVNNIPLRVMQESYSHEVSSAGFWPGNEAFPHPAFYSYAYPIPADFGTQKIMPVEAFYSKEMGEFFLLYDDVRKAAFPEKMLMEFLQSTYDAAAETGNWDKKSLEFNYF
ncbi:hypothetical protein FW778_22140 [Ginsengibacter hankyongi]|uniref:Ava_C0101 and related proteins n=1 Tax=Ginsengibacter hankyongi TaxID=2607284 RepID=A0A5J5I9N6_9BACT|nr:DUF5996 family protein [Ginsengibacter hankyongi]KAA9034539.1 hypothetical protein FW778_22140 [Ginsengibacter hankyongi]